MVVTQQLTESAIAEKARGIIKRRQEKEAYFKLCFDAKICPYDGAVLGPVKPDGLKCCPVCNGRYDLVTQCEVKQ